MTPEQDEARLIRRLRRRDEEAFVQLVTTYQNRVFGLVYRMLGDQGEAEDVAQEVFVTVFKSIDSFREESKFSTWLFRIATNHCKNRIKYLQRRHHQRTKELDDSQESEFQHAHSVSHASPQSLLEGAEMESIIQTALNELDEDHRVVIILRDVDQVSYQEIAEILGVAEGTVKSRLFRARMALKDRITARYQR